jgi:hypothetical protein
MSHFKRGRPSGQTRSCRMCKPWKLGGRSIENPRSEKYSDHKRRIMAKEELNEHI